MKRRLRHGCVLSQCLVIMKSIHFKCNFNRGQYIPNSLCIHRTGLVQPVRGRLRPSHSPRAPLCSTAGNVGVRRAAAPGVGDI